MKKGNPAIDYKTAQVMVRMYDFIIGAYDLKKSLYNDIEGLIASMRRVQERCTNELNSPNEWAEALNYNHIDDPIADIRHDAWEAGLTHTLFEKLKDRQFRNRFTGWLGSPVLEEEIKDHYEWEDEETEAKETNAVNA
jgi:hypothetical protein